MPTCTICGHRQAGWRTVRGILIDRLCDACWRWAIDYLVGAGRKEGP